jgi:putative membrane protein
MSSPVSRFFTDADKDRIRDAVHSAEKKTSGEIVPYLVEQSDEYEVAEWRGGAILASMSILVFVVIHVLTSLWLPVDFVGVILIALCVFAVGMLAVKFVPSLKRLFAGKELLALRVHQRASQAFIAEEVFKTRERTGILLFISLLEHQVAVLADSGINARVKQEEWNEVVQVIIRGITRGAAAGGIVDAIQQCGDLLQRRGIDIRTDDTDELSDKIRMSER